MNDHARANEIYSAIGQKLWSIMRPDAAETYFRVALQGQWSSAGSSWLNRDGSKGYYLASDKRPEQVEDEIEVLLEELKDLQLFSSSRWTRARVTLTEAGKFSIDFARVHDEDSHPNLHMKGISDLSRQEAYDQLGVSSEDWAIIAHKAAAHKKREAEESDVGGDLNQRDLLRTQVHDIEKRLADAGR